MTAIFTDFSQPSLARCLVEADMADQFAYFHRSPLASVERTPELLKYRSGIPIAEYNGVMRTRFSPDLGRDELAARIHEVVASFQTLRQPFLWWLGPSIMPVELGEHLARAGLTPGENAPGMAADLAALDERLPRPADLSIVRVEDERTLRDWVDVAGAGYGELESIRQARYDVHAALGLGQTSRSRATSPISVVGPSPCPRSSSVQALQVSTRLRQRRRRDTRESVLRSPARRCSTRVSLATELAL